MPGRMGSASSFIQRKLHIWLEPLKQPVGEEELTREIRKYFESNKNKSTTYKNVWDKAKAEA